jgi:hypothetical protein
MERQVESEGQQPGRKASPLRVFKAVFWSFFGVRRRADNQDDLAAITPLQVIVAGVIGAIIFVASLVTLVSFIVR